MDDEVLGLHLPPTQRFYRQMRMIRTLEENLLAMFDRNLLSGTTHTCIGQEADAVGILDAVDRARDTVWSNHRCHGHFLAYCGEVDGLLAEIMGRTTGVCGGRGGSQHLCLNRFHSNGIQGGIAPLAVGTALADRDEGALSVVFMGDGTMGEGIVYEALNLAALWSAPVLFVVEDNGIAQTTPSARGIAGDIAKRAEPFGIRSASIESTDVFAINDLARQAVAQIRAESRPFWLHIRTQRMGPHSKGDDTRPAAVIAKARAADPLALLRPQVTDAESIDAACAVRIATAIARAEEAPPACA